MPKKPTVDCTALSPGLWRVALPFPSPLGHSFSYLLQGSDGFVAVDVGWNLDETWAAFNLGLARAGGTLADLIGVVITHGHPDHIGLAQRITENSDAWIGLHPADRPLLVRSSEHRVQRMREIDEWVLWCGVPADERSSLLADRQDLARELPVAVPTVDILDGAVIPGTDGAVTAIHTPGHTQGHLVFHDTSRNVTFTGDHLLPRVSANISYRPTSGSDPLGDYAQSLGKLTPYLDSLVAPGHEWTFDKLGKRLDEVRAHHDERLGEILEAVRSGATTAWGVASTVTWSRPFRTLNPRGRRSAIGEAASHLIRLELDGKIDRVDGTTVTWVPHRRG